MAVPAQFELLGLKSQELTGIAEALGQPAYRGGQLFTALYRQRISGFDEITTLPKSFREQLGRNYVVGLPRIEKRFISADGTIRYLLALGDGELVETVWMPEGDGGETGDTETGGRENGSADSARDPSPDYDRATICVSSQIGCAVNCRFCLTALLGIKRNLTPGEIVGQLLCVLNDRGVDPDKERINVVFMGMGEPFHNYDHFMKAVRLLIEGVNLAESRMTVSTAGIVPKIREFGQEKIRPKLAISLNASNDELRSRLMPINRKWNLAALLAAAREFPLRARERLTFEYVLLNEVNDQPQNARELVSLVRGLRCKVNLIALNPGQELEFGVPSAESVQRFQQILTASGVPAFVRHPRGRDVYAACGQLKQTFMSGSPEAEIAANGERAVGNDRS
jgi:23S rRNA (adenine2503-C2)-methyltransferase